jgi:hypothetical protein
MVQDRRRRKASTSDRERVEDAEDLGRCGVLKSSVETRQSISDDAGRATVPVAIEASGIPATSFPITSIASAW